jgi:hypothetical protein
MRRFVTVVWFVFLLIAGGLPAAAQFAVVKDRDGYVLVREKGSTANAVLDTLPNDRIVFCNEKKGDWIYVLYQSEKESSGGYVHKSRLVRLETFQHLERAESTDNTLLLKGKPAISVRLTVGAFEAGKYPVRYDTVNGYRFASRINGKPFFGTDGTIPKRRYRSITVQLGDKVSSLPAAAFDDLFEPNFPHTECYFDPVQQRLFLTAINSDGAGGYVVTWVIDPNGYRDRMVTNGF